MMLTTGCRRAGTRAGDCGCAPAVAGLVEVEAHAVAVQVDDVGGAGAVDVGQADALVVELVRVVEPGRVVHRDLGAEAAVAQVGPVADLAVADAHEVGQAVAATCRRGRWTACRRRRPSAGLSLRPAACATRWAGPKPSSASEGARRRRRLR